MDSDRIQNPLKTHGPLLLAGVLLLCLFAWMSTLPSVPVRIHAYVAVFGAAFAVYLLSYRHVRTREHDRHLIVLIFVFAALFRLVFIPTWPTLSTDFHRYVWDGKVQNSGINPYRYCPGSPNLAHLRDARWSRVNYKRYPPPYPPGAEAAFAAAYRLLPDSSIPLKSLFVVVDLLTCFLILRILKITGLPRSAVIVYAWSPLVVTEFAGSGHIDALAVWALTLALALATAKPMRNTLALAGLGLSVMIKALSAPLLPLFLRKHGLKSFAGFAAVVGALTFPYAWEGDRVSAGILTMAKGIRKNTGLFGVFDTLASFVTPHHDKVAVVLGAITVAVVVFVVCRRDQSDSRIFIRSAMAIMAAVLLVSPVIYPWYITWIVPFLCFVRSPGWLAFTGLVVISYLLPFHGQALWIKLVEYMPFYGLLVWSAVWGRWLKRKN